MDTSKYWAKSDKVTTLVIHNAALREALDKLYELGYIEKEMYELLKIACEYHDFISLNASLNFIIHYLLFFCMACISYFTVYIFVEFLLVSVIGVLSIDAISADSRRCKALVILKCFA